MRNKTFISVSLGAVLLAVTGLASAEEQVLCPSLNLIKQTAKSLSNVTKQDNQYIVSTNGPALSFADKSWLVGAVVSAKDSNEALLKAQNQVTNVSSQYNQYAVVYNKQIYACVYQAPESRVVALAKYKDNVNADLHFDARY